MPDTTIEDGERPTMAVVRSVATASDTPATELAPLAEAIDPDAVNAILERPSDARLSFSYHGYRITVDSREVSVRQT